MAKYFMQERVRTFFASLITAAGLVIMAMPASAKEIKMTDLGAMGVLSGNNSRAVAINDAGQVVGDSTDTKGTPQYAFIWENGEIKIMAQLPATGIGINAVDINEKGQALIKMSTYSIGPAGYQTHPDPLIWENGNVTHIGSWGGRECNVYDINNLGQVVAMEHDYMYYMRATIWDNGSWVFLGANSNNSGAVAVNDNGFVIGTDRIGFIKGRPYESIYPMTDLGTLGGTSCYPTAINNNEQVVGWSTNASGERHAFLWKNGVMTDLGTLGGGLSEAYDINDAGQVVGMSTNSSGQKRAFLWEEGKMTDLGSNGYSNCRATAINEAGQVIGYIDYPNVQRAVLWENGEMIDLGTLGRESEPLDINNNGQIVGWSAFYDSNYRSWRHAILWDTNTRPLCPVGLKAVGGMWAPLSPNLIAQPGYPVPKIQNALFPTGVPTGRAFVLIWQPPATVTNVSGYRVYRDGAQITEVPETGLTSYSYMDDIEEKECVDYSYTVVSYNSSGAESENCESVSVHTPDLAPPTAPVVTATVVGATEISLSWQECADECDGKAAGYNVYDSGGVLIGTTAGTTYLVQGLSECTEHCFKVTAFDSSKNESAPGTACAKTPTVVAATSPMEGKCGGSYNINSQIVALFQISKNGVPLGPVQIGMPVATLYRVSGGALAPVGSVSLIGNSAGNWQASLKPADYGLTPGDYVIMIEPSPTGGTLCDKIVFEPAPACSFTLVKNGNGR